jgi:hypothetical protein
VSIQRTELPGGAWVDLRDASEIPERLRRPIRALQMRLTKDEAFAGVIEEAQAKGVEAVQAAMQDSDQSEALQLAASLSEESLDLMDQLNDRAVLARVAGWSFGPEVTLDALLDLPGPIYDRLRELAAPGVLGGGPDFSPSPDPESPTVPSTA